MFGDQRNNLRSGNVRSCGGGVSVSSINIRSGRFRRSFPDIVSYHPQCPFILWNLHLRACKAINQYYSRCNSGWPACWGNTRACGRDLCGIIVASVKKWSSSGRSCVYCSSSEGLTELNCFLSKIQHRPKAIILLAIGRGLRPVRGRCCRRRNTPTAAIVAIVAIALSLRQGRKAQQGYDLHGEHHRLVQQYSTSSRRNNNSG